MFTLESALGSGLESTRWVGGLIKRFDSAPVELAWVKERQVGVLASPIEGDFGITGRVTPFPFSS